MGDAAAVKLVSLFAKRTDNTRQMQGLGLERSYSKKQNHDSNGLDLRN